MLTGFRGSAASWLFKLTALCAALLAEAATAYPVCCLTFELRRDRRQDARPGPVKMYRVFAGKHKETVQDESAASYEGWCRAG